MLIARPIIFLIAFGSGSPDPLEEGREGFTVLSQVL